MTAEEHFKEWWISKEIPEKGFNLEAMIDFAESYHQQALRTQGASERSEECQHQYFVAYKWYSDSSKGFGSIKYVTNRKMDIELIREIENELNKEEEVGKAIIINWQLF